MNVQLLCLKNNKIVDENGKQSSKMFILILTALQKHSDKFMRSGEFLEKLLKDCFSCETLNSW